MNLNPNENPEVCGFISRTFRAPVEPIKQNYPSLYAELALRKATKQHQLAVALGTIGVENAKFDICHEDGTEEYFLRKYWHNERVRKQLGNRSESDAIIFHGRGLIQLTGYGNYRKYALRLGLDLVGKPDLALIQENAVRIFAEYFIDHGLDVWANRYHDFVGDEKERALQKCRRLVNGGLTHYSEFKEYVKLFEVA